VDIDPKLFDYCTPRQREVLEAIIANGGCAAADRAMGSGHSLANNTLRRLQEKAARQGYAPGHFESGAAPGFLMGKVTVQRGPGGTVERTWERQSPDDKEREARLQQFIAELMEPIKGLAPLVPPPTYADADMLSVYPIGDQHHGMYADARETGADYDCTISAGLLTSAVDRLCASAPDSETALLLDVGDFHHANDSKNETPGHAHRLDVDTRYGNVMRTGGMALVHCVLRLLERHQRVMVWIMPGNHNPDAAFATAMAVAFYFHNEPRVDVDLGTSAFKFLRFGKNLIASHHGDGAKPADLPLLMAVDRPQDWAETEYRVWHLGHIHHRTVKEHPGCDVESHRTLAPSNSWDHKKGYRSKREMQRIDYHRQNGEVMRTRCDVAMLGRAA
jgi:hypothetical protein